MKTYLCSFLAILGLATVASAQIPLRAGDVKIGKVSPEVVKTPEFTYQGGPQKRSKIGQWLEVEVEYETKADMIDELTFSYKMLINGKLLVGDVTYVSIPKGRDHYAVAYIAPRSLENLMGGKQLNAAAIQGIWVDCTHQGQLLSQGALKPSQVPNLPQVPGFILNKSQTPFSILFWDRYEALKPNQTR
jgi:hypothetical protein